MQKRICKSFANAFNNNCLFHLLVFRFFDVFVLMSLIRKRRLTRKFTCMNKPVQNKKTHPIKSDELVMFSNCLSYVSDLSFRRGGWNWHLFSISALRIERGCQGVIGPLPSTFLDKCPVLRGLKELSQS